MAGKKDRLLALLQQESGIYLNLKQKAKDPGKAKAIDQEMRSRVNSSTPLAKRISETRRALQIATRKMRKLQ